MGAGIISGVPALDCLEGALQDGTDEDLSIGIIACREGGHGAKAINWRGEEEEEKA